MPGLSFQGKSVWSGSLLVTMGAALAFFSTACQSPLSNLQSGAFTTPHTPQSQNVVGSNIPSPPTNLTTVTGDSKVILSWSAPSGQGGITYNILRSESPGEETTLATTNSTSYTDTTVTNGNTYYYRISATATGGTSADSTEVWTIPPYGRVSSDWIGGAARSASGFQLGTTVTSGSGDGMFNGPTMAALDSVHGYMYVSDCYNNRVEKFTLSRGAFVGAIGALAESNGGTCPTQGAAPGWCTGGTFMTGSGDGMLSCPGALQVDPASDSLYVVDQDNNRVSKFVASTGAYVGSIGNLTASTGSCPASGAASSWCTGGTFSSANVDGAFQHPVGLAIDSADGLLFVSGQDSNKVSLFTLSSGYFLGAIGKVNSSSGGTCPASGAAPGWCTGGSFGSGASDGMFNMPQNLVADPSHGFLYVTDYGNGRISKIQISTGAFVGAIGELSASSGSCPASGVSSGWCTGGTFTNDDVDGGFSGPTGVEIDSSNDQLYITDDAKIAKYTLSTGAFIGAIGNLNASSGSCPASGAASGWCTGGTYTHGSGDGMFSGLGAVVLDPTNGSLYAADRWNKRIVKVDSDTGAIQGALGAHPEIASGWSSDTPSFTTSTTFSTADGLLDFDSGGLGAVAVDTVHGYFYVANNFHISKFNLSTGLFVGSIGAVNATSTGTCPSTGVTSGWCTGGAFTQGSADGAFSQLFGIAIDPIRDALYVADPGNARVDKYTLSSGAFVGAIGMLQSSTGTCPSSGMSTNWCTGGSFTTGTGGESGFFGPYGISVDSTNGYLYVGDQYAIEKFFLTSGTFVGGIGNTTASTGTCPASGAATGWCTGGTFTSGYDDGTFAEVAGLAIDPARNLLYAADASNHQIDEFILSSGSFAGAIGKVWSSTGTCPTTSGEAAPGWCTGGVFDWGGNEDGDYSEPLFLAINPKTQRLYVTEYDNNRVSMVNASTGAYLGSLGMTTASTGSCPSAGAATTWCTGGTFDYEAIQGSYRPSGIDIDQSTGELFVADVSSHVIRITTH